MTLDDLSRAVAAYRDGNMSLDAFEDWFRTNSRGMFGENEEVLEACLAVEAAFSSLRYDGDLAQFRKELGSAIRPLATSADSLVWNTVSSKPTASAKRLERCVQVA